MAFQMTIMKSLFWIYTTNHYNKSVQASQIQRKEQSFTLARTHKVLDNTPLENLKGQVGVRSSQRRSIFVVAQSLPDLIAHKQEHMNAVSGLDNVKVKCDFFEFCLSCYVNPVAIVCKYGLWLRIISERRPCFSTISNLYFEFCSSSFFHQREQQLN